MDDNNDGDEYNDDGDVDSDVDDDEDEDDNDFKNSHTKNVKTQFSVIGESFHQ